MQVFPRIAPKVTKTHLDPNTFQTMNVGMMAELLSGRVGAGVVACALCGKLPKEAVATGKFIGELNDFFDSWNGIAEPEEHPTTTMKTAVTSQTKHIELWNRMYHQISNWKFINSANLTFPKHFLMTIRSAINLWHAFQKEGRTYFPIGHMNQDSLENFFSTVRWNGGHCHNPSAKEFVPAFVTSLVNMLTTTVK